MHIRAIFAGAALLAALLMATLAGADDNPKKDKKSSEPTAAQLKIAKAIATGHAYEKHVVEEKLFPEVKSKDDFVQVIAKVLANPTHHRKLENDREAYFDKKSNTIVIYNPHARDKGTCFRPRAGLKYFEGLK
jgi:pyocin large subunit-like protein